MKKITLKIRKRLWQEVVMFSRSQFWYPKIYPSYWHSQVFKPPQNNKKQINFYTAQPNTGAGIGHQMANWIAGYWFAHKFGLQYAHSPFPNQQWEAFLGFGNNEITVEELQQQGYKKVRLPLFDENNQQEIKLNKKIISSYENKKVVFMAEQDQFYADQFGNIEELKKKFYQDDLIKKQQLIYSPNTFNIAIHVRRGDITVGQTDKNPNLLLRWQDNSYFENVLTEVVENLNVGKPVAIYLFSQGQREDFPEFEQFENIHFCLEMGAQDSFLHMTYADLLITSKSSFSYKPALLSNGIKVCPENFWHGYLDDERWILAEDNGYFDIEKLEVIQ